MKLNIEAYLCLMRLHQPTGIYLLLWPCFWGLSLAGSTDIKLFLIFAAGSVIMRGAGCVINDLWDRDFDRQVERTKNRPLASGEITPISAFIFLAFLLGTGLFILLQLPAYTIILGTASMLLVISYPLMKRITFWPQLFLGFTFNFGTLMGYSAAAGKLDMSAFLLYAAAIFWTLGYDTIYAFQDIKHDVKAGIKSSAIRLKDNIKPALAVIYGLCIMFMLTSIIVAKSGLAAFTGVAFFAIHLGWQIYKLSAENEVSARQLFQSNRVAGIFLWAGLLLDYIIN